MGRNKQRTKNNTRPSNSQRSAELLGVSCGNFVGFSSLTEAGYVPVNCLKEVDMNHVDPSFQMVLRKMNKKDSTTKCKALQEFADLCQNAELSNVEAALPFWPRLYCNLATDVEHRVREAAQLTHAALVKRVGKKIAIHLKQLSGAWFVSQYDTYPPASSAAQNSFNDTFSPNKIVCAIVHCQVEILDYIYDNIIVQTPQTLTIKKSLTEEEMENKYQRILVSSLQAYAFYIKTVSSDEINKMLDRHRKIINDSKFWKLAKHKDITIRTTFMNVLSSIIQNAPCLLNEEKKRIVSTVMNSIDESEPLLAIAVWECILVTINIIKDWHLSVNIEKAILPKVWRILKTGGLNCTTIIYPNLLPLLGVLTKVNIDKEMLFMKFFENMREGMQSTQVCGSRSEPRMLITTFYECLRYAILSNNNNTEMCTSLIKKQLIPVVKYALSESCPQRFEHFCEIAQLLRYWSKNRDNAEFGCYSHLVNFFWLELKNLYNDIYQSRTEFPTCLQYLSDLLLTVRNTPINKHKSMKVVFSDSVESYKQKHEVQTKVENIDEKLLNELEEFIITFCTPYFENVINRPDKTSFENLINLASKFQSKRFFETLAKLHNTESSLLKFYEEIVNHWFLCHTNEVECVMSLVFIILEYVNDEEKERILRPLLHMGNQDFVANALQCALSNKVRNNKCIKNWLKDPKITHTLIDTAKNLLTVTLNDERNRKEELLCLAFEVSDEGDLFVSEEAINCIASILCAFLIQNLCLVHPIVECTDVNNEDNPLNAAQLYLAKLISKLLELTWNHRQISSGAIEMLDTLSLFNIEVESTDYKIDSINIVCDIWKKSLSKMLPQIPSEEFVKFVTKFARALWQLLFKSNEFEINCKLINVATECLSVILKSKDSEEWKSIANIFFSSLDIKEWMEQVYRIIMSAEIMHGNIYVPKLQINVQVWQDVHVIDLSSNRFIDYTNNCLKWALISIEILKKLNDKISRTRFEEQELEKNTEQLVPCPDILTNIMRIINLGRKYANNYKSSKNYIIIKTLLKRVEDSVSQLLPNKFDHYLPSLSDDLKLNSTSIDDDLVTLIHSRNTSSEDQYRLFNDIISKVTDRQKEPNILLHDCNIYLVPWEKLTLPLEIIRLITVCINDNPTNLTVFQWDFVMINLASWNLSMSQSSQHFNDFKVIVFTTAVIKLYCVVQHLLKKHELNTIKELPPELLDEWKNVFVENIDVNIVKIWILFGGLYNKKDVPLTAIVLMDELSKAMQIIDGNIFYKQTQIQTVTCTELIEISLKFLQSPILSLQLGAYHALQHVIKEIVKRDKAKIEIENFDQKSLYIWNFEETLTNLQNIVNTVLADFNLCDPLRCTIETCFDSYNVTLGYLLTWATILDMCANADGDLRYQYAEMLKNDFFVCLLNNIFKLMPVEVLHDNKSKSLRLVEMYNSVPLLDSAENWTVPKLDHIVWWLYTNCLRYLPVLVRQWWSTADGRVSAAVDRITSLYISPTLCQEELSSDKITNMENMQIKVYPTIREVIALYEMDDTKLELSITLPVNYPLGSVTIVPGQHVKGSATWANCHMQLSIFLTHQNGSIWEGIMLWKKNLDKRFTGVEECYICFSIFHVNTYQIPKLLCRTCRKKFHTPCLYKWFNTSQKSTCPICRNVF